MVAQCLSGDDVIKLQTLTRDVVLAPEMATLAATWVRNTHPSGDVSETKNVVRYGASPRAVQALVLAARANALMNGRSWVSREDLQAHVHAVLQHRILMHFDAVLDGISAKSIVDAVIR